MKESAGKDKSIKRIMYLIFISVLVFIVSWITGRFDSLGITWLNELIVLALKGVSIIGFLVGSVLWLTFCRLCRECETVWTCNFDYRLDD